MNLIKIIFSSKYRKELKKQKEKLEFDNKLQQEEPEIQEQDRLFRIEVHKLKTRVASISRELQAKLKKTYDSKYFDEIVKIQKLSKVTDLYVEEKKLPDFEFKTDEELIKILADRFPDLEKAKQQELLKENKKSEIYFIDNIYYGNNDEFHKKFSELSQSIGYDLEKIMFKLEQIYKNLTPYRVHYSYRNGGSEWVTQYYQYPQIIKDIKSSTGNTISDSDADSVAIFLFDNFIKSDSFKKAQHEGLLDADISRVYYQYGFNPER